jgi:hypothetical protein
MATTSNIALQTFLELQTVKAMVNNTKIELWQQNTTYDANKPIRYNNKLYICNLAHTSGSQFDITKFDALEASGISATNATIDDTNIGSGASTVQGVLEYLKSLASSGKSTVATAITGKGGTANGSMTYQQLADAIGALSTGGGDITKETRLNITAPYNKTIVLTNARDIEDLCTSILEYVPGQNFTTYTCNFNNGDASSFNYSNTYVNFDGQMKLKTSYAYNVTNQGALGAGTLYESDSIVMANYNDVNAISASESGMTITAVPLAQVVKANGDIDLTGIAQLSSIALTATVSGAGKVKTAISVNGGTTWKTYYNDAWVSFNPDNKADFNSYGMTEATLEALTFSQLEQLRNGSTTLRFAYYLERPAYSDDANTDQISLDVLLPGASEVCNTAKYTLSYDENTKTITYTINTNGTYTFTYAD